jgi:hypothetical protein
MALSELQDRYLQLESLTRAMAEQFNADGISAMLDEKIQQETVEDADNTGV